MKRLFVSALTCIVLLAVFTSCMISKQHEKNNENKIAEKEILPVETIDLKIDSFAELNYYTAVYGLLKNSENGNQKFYIDDYGIPCIFIDENIEKTDVIDELEISEESSGEDEPYSEESQETDSIWEEESAWEADSSVDYVPEPPVEKEIENIYYYEIDPNELFHFNKISLFQIELTDENGFLASKFGTGIVDVIITDNAIWGDNLITFRKGKIFYSCLQNGGGRSENDLSGYWEFSTHKYVDGFNIIKNFEQENYRFNVFIDIYGNVESFECLESQNGGYRADKNIKIMDGIIVSEKNETITINELENYFKNVIIEKNPLILPDKNDSVNLFFGGDFITVELNENDKHEFLNIFLTDTKWKNGMIINQYYYEFSGINLNIGFIENNVLADYKNNRYRELNNSEAEIIKSIISKYRIEESINSICESTY